MEMPTMVKRLHEQQPILMALPAVAEERRLMISGFRGSQTTVEYEAISIFLAIALTRAPPPDILRQHPDRTAVKRPTNRCRG